ncbi:hypothetical protein CC78DRAFT_473582, partial [Lojkania enalia]
FLGIRVIRDTNIYIIYLVQDMYIDKVTVKYNIIAIGHYSKVPMTVNYLEQSIEELN